MKKVQTVSFLDAFALLKEMGSQEKHDQGEGDHDGQAEDRPEGQPTYAAFVVREIDSRKIAAEIKECR